MEYNLRVRIQVIDLTKKYGTRRVVNKVNFEVRNDQILALLGPNGAGKSTIIKMLSGQIHPSSGRILIDDTSYRYVPAFVRSRMGVTPQEIVIWDSLTVRENLDFAGRISGVSSPLISTRRNGLIEALSLGKELNTVAKVLSGGYKRRLNLAITLMSDPSALFLDEPTPGIDPQNRSFLLGYIKNLRQSDRSIILTDHYLEEAEQLADYVVIIDNSEVIVSGTVSELKKKYGKGTLLLVTIESSSRKQAREFVSRMKTKERSVKLFSDIISIQTTDERNDIKLTLRELERCDVRYKDISMKEPSLEDIFLILTGKNLRE